TEAKNETRPAFPQGVSDGGGAGNRTSREIPSETIHLEGGGAESGAPATTDPDLAVLIAAWLNLPEPIRAAIRALVGRAARSSCPCPVRAHFGHRQASVGRSLTTGWDHVRSASSGNPRGDRRIDESRPDWGTAVTLNPRYGGAAFNRTPRTSPGSPETVG